jgi:hypothetical protein
MDGLVSTYDFKHKLLDGLGANNGITSGVLASSNYGFVDTILGKMARSQNPGGICFGDGFKNQSNFFASLWYHHITDSGAGWIMNQYLTDALGYGLYIVGDSLSVFDDINDANTARYTTTLIPGKTYHFLFGINSSDLCKLWIDSVPAANNESASDSFTSVGGNLYLCGRNLPLPLPLSRFVPGLCGPPSIFNQDMVDSDASELYAKGAKAIQFAADWGHKADGIYRGANEYLGGGPLRISDGTPQVSERVITSEISGRTVKAIEHKQVSAFPAYAYFGAPWSNFGVQGAETGYGSWSCWAYVPSGAIWQWDFLSSGIESTDPGLYSIYIDEAGGVLELLEDEINLIGSTANFPTGEWFHLHVTRRYDGLFEVFINGTSEFTGTDTTHSSGSHMRFQWVGDGCKVALADSHGGHAITKYLGVTPPNLG